VYFQSSTLSRLLPFVLFCIRALARIECHALPLPEHTIIVQEFPVIYPSALPQDLHWVMFWCDASYRCLRVQSSMLSPLNTIFHIVTWVCLFVSKQLSASLHVFEQQSPLLLFLLHPSCYYQMKNDDLDQVFNLPHGMIFSTWRPLDSSVGTTLCNWFEAAELHYPPECRLSHSLVLLDALSLWPRKLLLSLQFFFVVSRWLLPKYPRQVPLQTLPFRLHRSAYWLTSRTTGCHTRTASVPLPACHKALVKTLPIQAILSWSLHPLVPLCTAAFSFVFSSFYILLPFCLFVWTVTCRYFAMKTIASEHADLCAHPVIAFSLPIALDIRLFLLILRPLSSKLLCARLPHGNLGEPSTKHTLRSLRIWCCPVATTLSSALTALCLLSYPSSILLWVWPTCCSLRRFLFHRLPNGRCCSSFSLDLHQTTQSFDLPIVFDHCSCSYIDKLSHTTTVGQSSSPRTLGLLV